MSNQKIIILHTCDLQKMNQEVEKTLNIYSEYRVVNTSFFVHENNRMVRYYMTLTFEKNS